MDKEKNNMQTNMEQEKNEKKKVVIWWKNKKLILGACALLILLTGLFIWKPWNKPSVPIETEQEVVENGVNSSVPESKTPKKDDTNSSAENKEATEPKQEAPTKTEEPKIDTANQENSQQSAAVQQPKQETTQTPAVQQQPAQQPAQQAPTVQQQTAATHTHNFDIPIYETRHVAATYKTVHHDAVTEQKYVVDSPAVWQATFHCSCGYATTSGSEIDAHMLNAPWDEEHNYGITEDMVSAEVGHYETVVVSEAYDEQVIDQPERDEQVVVGYKCSCGATQ